MHIVISNFPNQEIAQIVARLALEKNLTACVNILAPCQSLYFWQGALEDSQEIPVLFKTNVYPELEKLILEHHPYELPEIIAIPIEKGLPAYMDWVAMQCAR